MAPRQPVSRDNRGRHCDFFLLCSIHNPLADAGLLHTPFMISLWFLTIAVAMSHELGADVLRAAQLVRQTQASEGRCARPKCGSASWPIPRLSWCGCQALTHCAISLISNGLRSQNGLWSRNRETAGRKAFAFKIFDIATRPTYIVSSFNARRPFSMEYRLRRADGANRRVLDHGAPRYMPEGEFAGYIGSCLDITER